MVGRQKQLNLAAQSSSRLLLGREPGPEGWILEGDSTVSRRHGELLLEEGELFFVNLSANGTHLEGDLLMGRKLLSPGALLRLGQHELEVFYHPPLKKSRETSEGTGRRGIWHEGLLARPGVRALLGAYLLGLSGLAIYLSVRSEDSAAAAYERARAEYREHYLFVLPEAIGTGRLERADQLVLELEAHIRSRRWELAEIICRELMALDRDPRSPLYRFGALRLAAVKDRK